MGWGRGGGLALCWEYGRGYGGRNVVCSVGLGGGGGVTLCCGRAKGG